MTMTVKQLSLRQLLYLRRRYEKYLKEIDAEIKKKKAVNVPFYSVNKNKRRR